MQSALRATGLQSAGRPQLPRSQCGCVALRAGPSFAEAASPKEQQALAVASFLASSLVAVASAAPAFADEALVATLAPTATEASAVAPEAIADGIESIPSLAAPALEEVTEVAATDVEAVPVVEAAVVEVTGAEPEASAVPAAAVEEAVAESEVAAVVEEPVAAAATEVPVVAEVEAVPIEEPVVTEAAAEPPAAAVEAEPVVTEAAAAAAEVPLPVEAVVEAEEAPAPVEAVAAPVEAVVQAVAPLVSAAAAVDIPVEAVAPAAAAAEAASSPFDLQGLLAGAAAASGASADGPSAETLTYVGLGAAAFGFLATFLVAPRFRESFKEPVDWKDMYSALAAKGVKTVTAEEAFAKAKKGAVLLDVRLADKFESRAASSSVSVPLYQPIAKWDPASNVRRAGFAFFGIFGTELNEDFVADVMAKVPKNKEVIVMCESGGTIDNKPGTQFGFQSRSLKAVYYLQQAGYNKVLHMKGGLGDWQRAGLPLSDASEQAPQPAAKGRASGSSTTSVRSGNTSKVATSKGTTSAKVGKELVSAASRGRK